MLASPTQILLGAGRICCEQTKTVVPAVLPKEA
jgi:hypothetical protein